MMHQHFRQPFGVVLGGFCALISIFALAILPLPTRAEESAPPAASPTLWSFAWVSDMHMNAAKVKYMARAMRYIDAKLKPHFVMFTGDNNYNPAPSAKKHESLALRRQRFFKKFLKTYLQTPCVVIPGDNWPQEFENVFGPKQYSFDCGGIHFLFLAPDRIYHGKGQEGLSVFDGSTWEWIQTDLKTNRTRPTIVVIHEPIHPLTFLDSPPMRKLLKGYPNVFMVLQGHLHVDLEYRKDGKCYLVAPALGEPPTPGMKLLNVTHETLIVRTILYNKKTKKFEMQDRQQIIEIPVELRSQIARPKSGTFEKTNYKFLPVRPLVIDPSLEKRKGEIVRNSLMNLYNRK